MAFAKTSIKLTWGGSLASGQDIWSCGLHIGNIDNTNIEVAQFNQLNGDIEEIATAIHTFHTAPASRVPSGVRIQWVKLALIDESGKYMTQPIEHIFATEGAGGVSAGYVPQNSAVVTLVSSKFKDPGKYNRFYVPTASPTTASTYKMTQSQAEGLASAAATMVTTIQHVLYAADTVLRIVIASSSGLPFMDVMESRVGTVIDTQRRRRNKITEDYYTVTILPPVVE